VFTWAWAGESEADAENNGAFRPRQWMYGPLAAFKYRF